MRKAVLSWIKNAQARQYVLQFREVGGSWSAHELTILPLSATKLAIEIELDDILETRKSLGDSPYAYEFRLKSRLNASQDSPADSEFSDAITIIDTPITVANGDSRNAPRQLGQADLNWTSVQGNLGSNYAGGIYSFRYRRFATFHATANWSPKTDFTQTQTEMFDAEDLSNIFATDQTSNEDPITDLRLEHVYAIQLRYEGSRRLRLPSGHLLEIPYRVYAARDAYVWPSKRSAGIGPARPNGERVASYPMGYRLDNATYTYIICESTFPDGLLANRNSRREAWKKVVNHAFGQWPAHTNNLITMNRVTNKQCTEYSDYISDLEVKIAKDYQGISSLTDTHIEQLRSFLNGLANITRVRTQDVELNEIKMIDVAGDYQGLIDVGVLPEMSRDIGLATCIFDPDTDGCAHPYIIETRNGDLVSRTVDIYLSHANLTKQPPPDIPGGDDTTDRDDIRFNKCPDPDKFVAYEILVHEVAHALGIEPLKIVDTDGEFELGHPFDRLSNDSVLSYLGGRRCSPHPFDIMAIYAMYQVR